MVLPYNTKPTIQHQVIIDSYRQFIRVKRITLSSIQTKQLMTLLRRIQAQISASSSSTLISVEKEEVESADGGSVLRLESLRWDSDLHERINVGMIEPQVTVTQLLRLFLTTLEVDWLVLTAKNVLLREGVREGKLLMMGVNLACVGHWLNLVAEHPMHHDDFMELHPHLPPTLYNT